MSVHPWPRVNSVCHLTKFDSETAGLLRI